MVLARVIEPVSKLDSQRVLEEAGVAAASYRPVTRRLRAYAKESWRQKVSAEPGGGHTWPTSQRASWRAMPAGQVIRIRDGDARREFLAVAGIAGALLAARMTARSQAADLMLSIGEEKKAPGAARARRPPELIHSLLPGRKAGSSGTLGPSVPSSNPVTG